MTDELLDILWHSIGMTRKNYRWSLAWWLNDDNHRNHYCAPVDHLGPLVPLEALGMMKRGCTINDGLDVYFHVTNEGIRAAKAAFPKPEPKAKRKRKVAS